MRFHAKKAFAYRTDFSDSVPAAKAFLFLFFIRPKEAVGLEGGNMSSIAAKLDITVGSLTTSMNSLVKKGYTERERSEKDRRIVYIHLTGKGRQAFHHHAKFHEQMTDAVMAELGEEEVQVLGKTLKALTDFFRSYKK